MGLRLNGRAKCRALGPASTAAVAVIENKERLGANISVRGEFVHPLPAGRPTGKRPARPQTVSYPSREAGCDIIDQVAARSAGTCDLSGWGPRGTIMRCCFQRLSVTEIASCCTTDYRATRERCTM